MELSIIVPVYNCEAYIERTVDLLQTQHINDFEILLIDDGSTDTSAEICDEIASRFNNVRTFHLKNSGPGHARNEGIRMARGRYIAFCDADDQPAQNMYGLLLATLLEQRVDYVMCDIYSERDNRAFGFPWIGDVSFLGDSVISELLASMLGNPSDNDMTLPIWGSCVRGIYRRDILDENGIIFPENIRFAEDLVFNVRYLRKIHSCYICNQALYRYTFNTDSLMNSHVRYGKTFFAERIKLVDYIIDELNAIMPHETLMERFRTSQRCYFIECVGNAARAVKTEGYKYAFNEIQAIVNHRLVKNAFRSFDAQSTKKRISYSMMQRRSSLWLLLYYMIRLR